MMDGRERYFKTVATHLLSQNAKAWLNPPAAVHSPGAVCAYRSPGGLKCAAGCMIPDELYDPKMERKMVERVIAEFPAVTDYFPDPRLASDLQRIHDGSFPVEWPAKLETLGQTYGFNIDFITAWK